MPNADGQAAAHAQKHSERRQQSESYDTERDTRLVKAAFDCAWDSGSNPRLASRDSFSPSLIIDVRS